MRIALAQLNFTVGNIAANTDKIIDNIKRAKQEGADLVVFAEFAVCKNSGASADSAEAQTLVAGLQEHITENYYTCTKEILSGLGQMYVLDERFRNNIDKHGDGTAEFSSKAIKIYCK